MKEVQIPQASLERLRQAAAQYEQLAQVIAEALGLNNKNLRLDIQAGTFIVEETPVNGRVEAEVA